MKLVQFGAGNIGRSFIGQVFSRAGWEVVFVDVDERLVSLLNAQRFYTVAIKREGRADEIRKIGPVRAVNGRDAAAVSAEVASADLAATSVGKNSLPALLPLVAAGLKARLSPAAPARPLDILIAENDREAPGFFRTTLAKTLGPSYPLDALAGIVGTSIGKMVPLMRGADLARDPLLLFAEEYETLIVDRRAFRGDIPGVPALSPVSPIAAYIDRKIFIHNLGHAATAYLGARALARDGAAPGTTIPQVLALPGVAAKVRRAMGESARALLAEYPGVFSGEELALYIEDLLSRFRNAALGDTVHRVGRDLGRKLAREDRLTGAMLLCAGHALPFDAIAEAYRAALDFAAPGEDGAPFPADLRFRTEYGISGALTDEALSAILAKASGLNRDAPRDSAIVGAVMGLRGPGRREPA
jgi:mannitol-1-phosphate 5-dehydrogenase